MSGITLRVPRTEDAVTWCALFDDPEVMRYIGDGSCRDQAYYDDLVREEQQFAEARGLCLFSVVVDGLVVGFAGVHIWSRPWGPTGRPEIGWRLGREYWSRGYATEASRSVLGLARECGLPHLVAMVQAGNSASAAVARRLGMTLEQELVSPEGTPVLQFGLTLTPRGRTFSVVRR
jgi:RimJ/RimL family protein N-acetyltransferase